MRAYRKHMRRMAEKGLDFCGEPLPKQCCLQCACLGEDNYCSWHGAFLESRLLNQAWQCEGYKPKKLALLQHVERAAGHG